MGGEVGFGEVAGIGQHELDRLAQGGGLRGGGSQCRIPALHVIGVLGHVDAEDEVVVVTSDRDLAMKARAAGAEVTSSRPFRAELDSL